MRAVRLIAYAILFAIVAFATAATIIQRNQGAIAAIALARIHDRTGFEVRITGTRMGFGSHLVVVLEHPRVFSGTQQIAQLDDIRAALSYRAIAHNSGLPLYRLILYRPHVTIPVNRADVTVGGVPRLDPHAVETLKWGLDALSDTAMQVEVIDAGLFDHEGQGLIEHFDLRAYRRHYRQAGNWPWLVDFDATLSHAPVNGMRITGSLSLGSRTGAPTVIATGQSWLWGLQLDRFAIGALQISAAVVSGLNFSIDEFGVLSGHGDLNLRQVTLSGAVLLKPIILGDAQLVSTYRAAPEKLELPSVTVKQGATKVIEASATMTHPYEVDRTLTFSAAGSAVDLVRAGAWLGLIRQVPPALNEIASRLDAGRLALGTIAINAVQPLRDWDSTILRDNLRAAVAIHDGGYQFPAATRLPPLRHVEAQLSYAAGALKLSQGALDLGASRANELNLEADLRKFPAHTPYKLRGKAALALTELSPAIIDKLRALDPAVGAHLAKLGGRFAVAIDAAGDWQATSLSAPREYLATVSLDQVTASTVEPTADIAIRQGGVTLQPGTIALDHVRVLPAGTKGGELTLNGVIEPHPDMPVMHDVTAELHQIAVERWLPLVIKPDALAADGAVGGMVSANTDPKRPGAPVITGKLTLSDGHLALGFMRSLIATRSATLTFDGQGLVLDLPGSELENSPLDFRLAVPDLAHPSVRIDATAAKLDFEAMNFIRLPWSPRRPPHFFGVPISGHIAAHQAIFDKLPLSEVGTDFTRDATDWHVTNFVADVFKGRVNLALAGHTGADNWIHIVGTIADMESGSIFLMLDPAKRPTMIGKLRADGDLWGNTDVDFFDTLAGTIALQVSDGSLDRLTLLSRLLALVDLKSWLTAQIPDPRVSGLPFKKVSGDFKGAKGDFYAENLRLDGPVMDLAASGDVQFGSGQVEMEIGVFPFTTANWIIHQIPIVGDNLAEGSSGLVAAYFHVSGPFKNPAIVPKPITSVTEFVKKMLGLPINIIAPNTIK
jgi:hypothetical protein